MPVTLTVGTNTYIDLAGAKAYLDVMLGNDAWAAADDDTKSKALITATRLMETLTWAGAKTVSSQALAWPRSGVVVDGVELDSAQVPQGIKDGECQLALLLLSDPTYATVKDDSGSNIQSVGAGSARVSYFKPEKGARFPAPIMVLFAPFLGGSAGAADVGGETYGTCNRSEFKDDKYGLNRGY